MAGGTDHHPPHCQRFAVLHSGCHPRGGCGHCRGAAECRQGKRGKIKMVTSTARHSGGPGWCAILLRRAAVSILSLAAFSAAAQQPFQLPTANHALFEPGGEEKFFVGTTGKPWTSGCFGCVLSDGWHMHERVDIRCLDRD